MSGGSRERFEKWAKAQGLWMSKDPNGDYLYEVTRAAFAAWSHSPKFGVSREKIEELPIHHFKINGVTKPFVECSDLRTLINKAGSDE